MIISHINLIYNQKKIVLKHYIKVNMWNVMEQNNETNKEQAVNVTIRGVN